MGHARDTSDDVGVVVGDIGSYSCKMGFAGEDFPRAYFTSVSLITFCMFFISAPFCPNDSQLRVQNVRSAGV